MHSIFCSTKKHFYYNNKTSVYFRLRVYIKLFDIYNQHKRSMEILVGHAQPFNCRKLLYVSLI